MSTQAALQTPDPAFLAVVEEHISRSLDKKIRETLESFVSSNEQRAREFSLLERTVRVEEELKALRETEAIHFRASEKRFEAMNERLKELRTDMNARFEATNERMDERFKELRTDMSKRFEAMDKRFDSLGRRMDRFMFWSLGLTVTATFLIISALR